MKRKMKMINSSMRGGVGGLFRAFIILIAFLTISISSHSITLGGLFNAFLVGTNEVITRNENECQNLAAFIMAVDEINNRYNNINHPSTDKSNILMSVSLGQNFVRTYPPNPYFDGASSIYQTHLGNPSIVGTIETNDNMAQVMASASTSNAFGSIMVMAASRSSVFKDPNIYPMTLQMASTTFVEAQVLGLLCGKYDWNQVAVFFSADTVGIDSFASFIQAKPVVLAEILIVTGQIDFSYAINEAKDTGATIFIFFLSGTSAGKILEQGHNSGLFHDGTQVLTTSTANIDDIRAAFTPQGLANQAMILKGFLTTAPFPEYYFSTPKGQEFVTKFRNLPSTMMTNPLTGVVTCSQRTNEAVDNAKLYTSNQTEGASGPTQICLGFQDFSQFYQNGSNIDPQVMYTYDAVYTYALSANNLLKQNASALSKAPLIEAIDIYAYLIASTTSFDNLVTGNVTFLPGRGVRMTGNTYKILNYQPVGKYNQYSQGGLAYVGEYTDSTGWLLCGSDEGDMSSTSRRYCTDPQYRTFGGRTPPLDAPAPIVQQLPYDLRVILIVFATIGMTSLIFWGVCLYVYWNIKQIRTSQPKIMSTLLVGGVLGLIKVYLAAFDVSHISCVCQLWLSHLAFRFIFRTLLLKLWRIHAVMNAGSFKRVIILENTVMWYLFSDVTFMTIALLIPITIVSSLYGGLAGYSGSIANNQTVLHAECQISSSLAVQVLNAILYFSDGLNLLMAVYYTYMTRAVPASVNETSTVGPAILGTVVSIVVVAVVSYTATLPSRWRVMLVNGAFLVIIILGCGLYFGKKMSDIYDTKIKDDKLSLSQIQRCQKGNKDIERTFLEMTLGFGGDEQGVGGETEDELLHELSILVGLLKKAHTPEGKLKCCNYHISQWRQMLILISDDLVSTYDTPCFVSVNEDDDERKVQEKL